MTFSQRHINSAHYPVCHMATVGYHTAEETMIDSTWVSFFIEKPLVGLKKGDIVIIAYKMEAHNDIITYNGLITRISDKKCWSF